MAKKYSPWFKCSEFKPVHVGSYQWKATLKARVDTDRLDYFDGKYWAILVSYNGRTHRYDNELQNYGYFRGLAEESK